MFFFGMEEFYSYKEKILQKCYSFYEWSREIGEVFEQYRFNNIYIYIIHVYKYTLNSTG